MKFNKLTLVFPDRNELLFRKKYLTDSIIQVRIALVLTTILYSAFGYLDTRMVPEHETIFHIIRYVFVVPFLSVVFLLSYTEFFGKIWQGLLFLAFTIGGAGISFMTWLAPENYTYYAGLMLIFSAGYFFIKLRFFLASIAGWITLVIFNIGAIFYSDASVLILLSNNFFFISANLIGMFAAYNIEYFARRDFYLNQELDRQKAVVLEGNKNLELIVDMRTKELIEAKDKSDQSDRLKTAFLANMSHEIRTPMNGILGFASLLKGQNLSGEKQLKYIQIIERSGIRMLNIINAIIDISKIESGLMEVDVKESDINEQMEFIYNFFKLEVEQKGMKLILNNPFSKEKVILKTDREKVYAILTNLVKNAVKYSNEGTIEFGYEIVGMENVRFYVKDTGIGIPVDRHEAIFERFIQADIANKQALQGAGLGLSIAKAYVNMLGGKIWVESEDGKGSVFYFTLPYSPEKIENPLTESAENEKDHRNHVDDLKILIAEDDETSEMFLEIALKNFSKEILKARTGLDAVKISKENPGIDLIMMDIQMPELNGYDATMQIRQFNKNVIIIAQTAYGLADDKVKALEAGCNDYISKPILKDELQALIKKYFPL